MARDEEESKFAKQQAANVEHAKEQLRYILETESSISRMSRTQKDILKTLGMQETHDQMIRVLNKNISESGERQKDILKEVVGLGNTLAKEMAERLGSIEKEVPYQETLLSIDKQRIEAKAKLGAGNLAGDTQKQLEAEIKLLDDAEDKVRFLSKQKQIMDAQNEVQDRALELFGLSTDRIKEMGEQIGKFLTNPWLIFIGLIGLSIKKFVDIQNAGEEFRKTTGLTVAQMGKADVAVNNVYKSLLPLGVGIEEAYKAAAGLYEQFGNMTLLTEKNTKFVADMAARLGVAEETGAAFTKSMFLVGEDATKMGKTLEDLAAGAGVSVSTVMKDMADAAEGSYSFMSKHPGAFMKTAVEARKIGISMKQISDIADGLLDIESSLSNEMEAQILTGESLNLDAARYYALIGDQEKMWREITRQFPTIEKFNKMGPLAQRSYAQALGMSVEQLAETIKLRQVEQSLTKEQLADRARAQAQEKSIQGVLTEMGNAWKTIVTEVSSLFLPVMESLVPIMKGIATGVRTVHDWMIKLPDALKTTVSWVLILGTTLAAIMGARGLGKMVGGIGGMFGKIAGGVGRGMGSVTGGILNPLKDFINTVKPTQMIAASVAMVMIAGSIWIVSDALQKMANLKWETLAQAGLVLLGLVGAVVALGAIMTSGVGTVAILAGAFAMTIMGGAMWVVADAMEKMAASSGGLTALFGALMMLDPAKLIAVGASFGAIGAGMTAMAAGGAVAGIVNAVFGNLSGPAPAGQKDKLDTVIEKLDKLVEVVNNKSLDVYVDGRLVSKQLGIALQYGGK